MPQKRKHFSYKVDSYLKDKFLSSKSRQQRVALCCGGTEGCMRFVNHMRFLCVCSLSLLQVVGPWVLSVSEVVTILLIYFLATSASLVARDKAQHYHFSYWHSMEDVVGMACSRAVLLSAAYAVGVSHMHRPYLYASYLLAALVFPYILVKLLLFRYTQDSVPAAAIFTITATYSWLHVFAARRTVEWAKRRYQLGLGMGTWDDECGGTSSDAPPPGASSSGWCALKRSDSEEDANTCCRGVATYSGFGSFRSFAASGPWGSRTGRGPPLLSSGSSEDVPPESLADDDSKFLQLLGIKVHYKEFSPSSSNRAAGGASSSSTDSDSDSQRTGIVLVHGFGAGVFAWRHILEPLALQCHCRVIAFDRPAFGLTSRPAVLRGQPNPYTLDAQARLLLAACRALGLSRVLLVGHADGCLLALRAVAMAAKANQLCMGTMAGSSSNQQLDAAAATQPTMAAMHGGLSRTGSQNVSQHFVSNSSGLQASGQHVPQAGLAIPGSAPTVPFTGQITSTISEHGGHALAGTSMQHAGVAMTEQRLLNGPSAGVLHDAYQDPGSGGFGSSFRSAVSGGGHAGSVLRVPTLSHTLSVDKQGMHVDAVQQSMQDSSGLSRADSSKSFLSASAPSAASSQQQASLTADVSQQGTASHHHTNHASTTSTTSDVFNTPKSSLAAFNVGLGGSTQHGSTLSLRTRGGQGSGAGSPRTSNAGNGGNAAPAPSAHLAISVSPSYSGTGASSTPCQGIPMQSNSAQHTQQPDAPSSAITIWSRLSEATLPPSTHRSEADIVAASLFSNASALNDDPEAAPSFELASSFESMGHGGPHLWRRGHGGSHNWLHSEQGQTAPNWPRFPSSTQQGLPPRPAGVLQHVGSAMEGPMSVSASQSGAWKLGGTRHRRVQSTPPPPFAEGRMTSHPSQHGGLLWGEDPQMAGMQRDSPSRGDALASEQEEDIGPCPEVLGLVLLHPNLSGTQGPALSRLLASSRLGRSILRPLLRSELGEVANRRAWHNTHKLTQEVLDLYKAPLRVEGWCESLIETTRLRRDQAQGDLPAYLAAARHLPALVLTGEHDRLVPASKVELLSVELPSSRVSIIPGCGHLAHEEVPDTLLQQLVPFCAHTLMQADVAGAVQVASINV